MKSSIILAAMLASAALHGHAYEGSVRADSIETGVVGDRFHLMMVMRLDSVEIESNRRVIYTPVLVGENPSDTVTFDEVMLTGRRQHILYTRDSDGFEGTEVYRLNGRPQIVTYSSWVSYQPWMDYATLYLTDDLCGCGNILDRGRDLLTVIDRRPAEPVFTPLTCFITPEVEATKARSESGSAFIDFRVNRTEIRTDYRRNSTELAKITSTIDLVKNDPNVTITGIGIHGYASPEGSYANNRRLAEGRARSLADYVKSLYHFDDNVISVSSTPEDWEGLRRYVADSVDIDNREAILAVITDDTLEPDAREWKLKKRFPAQYAFLLADVYPALRHSDYEVRYTVRPFSVEEAREIFRTKPRQLSLRELYMVAQSYPAGSDEFNEVFDVAARLFPNDPVANLNAAISAVNRRDTVSARRYLDKAGNQPGSEEVEAAIKFLSEIQK